MKPILVGTDFSPIATEALRYAGRLAADSGAELIVVYADPFEPPHDISASLCGSRSSR
jgi:nucleotide-binding universal stress UspA family protein